MPDLEKIAENLSSLTVMEAASLVKMLEEKWGVSAAAPVAIALQITLFALLVFVLLRFGLLVLVVFSIFSGLANLSLLTFDSSAPFFGLGLFVTAVAFALAIYGWRTSLAGRSLMQDSLLKDS